MTQHPDSPLSSALVSNDRVVLAGIGMLFAGALAYAVHYGGLGLTFGVGLVLALASVAVALTSKGQTLSRVALPALGMAMVALLIHTARGHNEAHFAVFAFLAVLVVYRRAVPILAGAVAIAVHHLSFNYMQAWGWGPVCFTEPGFLKVVEHALYVVAESGVLLYLANRAQAEFRTAEQLTALAENILSADGTVNLSVAHVTTTDPASRKLCEAMEHIAAAMDQVRHASDTIRAASADISQGNMALQARTEQAASQLQETAAAVEEIAGTIRSSSDNARQANTLALKASDVATQGGTAVSRVVDTMAGIQNSSRKITDIIGVIDGIAFQTNILALNAAVEAARAGEQGRGFAVVAGEVRTLARRSAEAAKEIKQLITASVEQVESGSQLVGATGATIGDVVVQVKQVTDLVSLISTSSSEQNDGISQINTAINQLDQNTQQNAALVETTASSAMSLQQMADELSRAVAVFEVRDMHYLA
jgi:methyl-accepting chemotaxis protein